MIRMYLDELWTAGPAEYLWVWVKQPEDGACGGMDAYLQMTQVMSGHSILSRGSQ